jgi:hypothetical protein
MKNIFEWHECILAIDNWLNYRICFICSTVSYVIIFTIISVWSFTCDLYLLLYTKLCPYDVSVYLYSLFPDSRNNDLSLSTVIRWSLLLIWMSFRKFKKKRNMTLVMFYSVHAQCEKLYWCSYFPLFSQHCIYVCQSKIPFFVGFHGEQSVSSVWVDV